jgi:protease-4
MKSRFSQKHPLLFGLLLICAAVVLTFGATAFFVHLRSADLTWFSTGIGIVHVKGVIDDSRQVTDWIRDLAKDDAVEAVLVRIDSPGGVVAPSQEIYEAIRTLAQKKPVVASMGAVAASGGYYVACGANWIVANPGSITGSIGVKAQLLSFEDLMHRIGVRDQTVSSGELKNAGSPTQSLTPAEEEYLQELVHDLHEQFVLAVARGRNMEVQRVRELADGRALTGSQAQEAGLVDSLGSMQAALDTLQDMAGIAGRVYYLEGPEEPSSLLSWILGMAMDVSKVKPESWKRPMFSYIYSCSKFPIMCSSRFFFCLSATSSTGSNPGLRKREW